MESIMLDSHQAPPREEDKKMAYGEDFRKRAMEMLAEGQQLSEVSQILNVGRATLSRWKQRQVRGELAAKYPARRKPYKIDEEKLKAYVAKHPDAYAYEIADAIGSKRGTVESALKRLKITRKKRHHSTANVTKKSAKST